MSFNQQDREEQKKLWNGVAGNVWAETHELVDQMFKPIAKMLVDAVSTGFQGRVLDVGCGSGGTTLAIARVLGSEGRCLGIDISEPMLASARTRASREGSSASFLCANAQTHAFEPASFDRIVSRFGVMFFDDPVQAFQNLRHAATQEAEMHVVTWRSPSENPFMTIAERAAAPLLPDLPPRRPDAPGQFGLANPQRIESILQESGWASINIQPVDFACAFPEQELEGYFTRFGPVGLILHEVDQQTRSRVIETVRTAFDPYVHGTEVRFDAACWMVSAKATA